MNRSNYESVLDRMKLQDGTLWPVPVCLDISETTARPLEAGQSVVIRDPEGFLLAIMHVEDIWKRTNKKKPTYFLVPTIIPIRRGTSFQ